MLITGPKKKEDIIEVCRGKKVVALKCFGCKEVYFPEDEINLLLEEMKDYVKGTGRFDYLCREEFAEQYLKFLKDKFGDIEGIVVFSCGVGVQVVSKIIPEVPVYPGCDTHHISGFQGITAQNVDCQQCGQCWLNITGGICPITSCSKGLLNCPCGGARDGKCEVNHNMDCGWVLIYNRLKALGDTEILKKTAINIRDYRLLIETVKKE